MKRYCVFHVGYYYPNGGMHDEHLWFDTISEVADNLSYLTHEKISKIRKDCNYTIYVWDMHNDKMVWDVYENELAELNDTDNQ